ncbi:hypothetical protein B1R94_13260 [Mycolicibacterium litorale]|nr:hypothetical protein B1R94_13260 [Mycolicibacterium litorale]
MDDVVDERNYAWQMIRAVRLVQAADSGGTPESGRADVLRLLAQALDAGLDRAEIIVELADLGARMLALCDPAGNSPVHTASAGVSSAAAAAI